MSLPGYGRTVEVMEARQFGELEAVAAGVPVPVRGAMQRPCWRSSESAEVLDRGSGNRWASRVYLMRTIVPLSRRPVCAFFAHVWLRRAGER